MSAANQTILREVSIRLGLFLSVVEQCFKQLSESQIWFKVDAGDNAIGNLALHIAGNLRQWIVSGVGGAPDNRNRAAEFEAKGGLSKQEVLGILQDVVEESRNIIASLPHERIGETLHVTDVDRTVAYALVLAVGHTGVHVGQIQFITRTLVRDAYKETWANPSAIETG